MNFSLIDAGNVLDFSVDRQFLELEPAMCIGSRLFDHDVLPLDVSAQHDLGAFQRLLVTTAVEDDSANESVVCKC